VKCELCKGANPRIPDDMYKRYCDYATLHGWIFRSVCDVCWQRHSLKEAAEILRREKVSVD
jgi:hypothetical protein